MVVTLAPSALIASMVQDFTAAPSICTTQAPHCDVSQPTCVPVSRSFSRSSSTRRVSGATSTACDFPLTVTVTVGMGRSPGLEETVAHAVMFRLTVFSPAASLL